MLKTELIAPHGGTLCELVAVGEQAEQLKEETLRLRSLTLTDRQLCDLELLLNGGFSPLTGFMTRRDYERVVEEMRLANGLLWPIPVTLDVPFDVARTLGPGERLALRDPTGLPLAVMTVEDVWEPDKAWEARHVFRTEDRKHPAVQYLFEVAGDCYVGGRIEGLQLPVHYDFRELRLTPAQLRRRFAERGWTRVVAFQTRNPMHRAHKELTDRAARQIGGHLLIHPVVGMTKPGDVDHMTRVRCYRAILQFYPQGLADLSLLPLAMRLAGPREALWHALIRKNYGCTHLIVGRDHAGPGTDTQGRPFYGPYEAQELFAEYEEELGVRMVPFQEMVYVPSRDAYMPVDEIEPGVETWNISGTQLRARLANGDEIPSWFTYPEVAAELRRAYPPRHQQGFCVFFTGLPCSGKSTLANALMIRLMELTARPVTLLDGDVVRTNLSKGLGFSKEDRSTNVRRIGYVASEIVRHRGIAICAPIAPYEEDRRFNRELISRYGGYIEVFVDAPVEVCEQRDVKGLYRKARAGLLKGFTGVDDPYETPSRPEVVIQSDRETVEEGVRKIIATLSNAGFLEREEGGLRHPSASLIPGEGKRSGDGGSTRG